MIARWCAISIAWVSLLSGAIAGWAGDGQRGPVYLAAAGIFFILGRLLK